MVSEGSSAAIPLTRYSETQTPRTVLEDVFMTMQGPYNFFYCLEEYGELPLSRP